ncbi:hypothetical protein DSUL_20359 [Desulfovibrionales bacterium]
MCVKFAHEIYTPTYTFNQIYPIAKLKIARTAQGRNQASGIRCGQNNLSP